ncbi:MAG TPA: hypothetical protein DCQ20_02120 [Nitrospira sp.]|nr:hypothetical protein [Nitrospira sp.]
MAATFDPRVQQQLVADIRALAAKVGRVSAPVFHPGVEAEFPPFRQIEYLATTGMSAISLTATYLEGLATFVEQKSWVIDEALKDAANKLQGSQGQIQGSSGNTIQGSSGLTIQGSQ